MIAMTCEWMQMRYDRMNIDSTIWWFLSGHLCLFSRLRFVLKVAYRILYKKDMAILTININCGHYYWVRGKPEKTDFLTQPIVGEVEPLITKEEFSIFKGDDKEEVEDKVSKLINTKLASKNITAKPALNLSDRIEVTLANGVSIEIPLYTERNTTGTLTRDVDPDQPYEDLMNFISQPVDQ